MLRGEIITVGSELLLGQITNTNSKYISMEMAGKGIPVFFMLVWEIIVID